MKVTDADIPGIKIITPEVFSDARGFFMESFSGERYAAHGLPAAFVQDNGSRSKKNVLRGLHFQTRRCQGKLVWVNRGAVFDAAVDVRSGSPTFGQSFSIELNDRNHLQVYVPPGFAHGFYALSDDVDFMYKCTDYYDAEAEAGLAWDDPDLGIDWPGKRPVLSGKDGAHLRLKDIDRALLPPYEP